LANASWRNQNATQTAQVVTITITADSTDNDETWTATFTLDDNTTTTVTYQEDGSPTVAKIATGLHTAFQASTHPELRRITSTNPSSGVWVLTGTAGRPFSVSLDDSGDGTHTLVTTTAGVSNNNYGQASNWGVTNAVPVNSDNVTIGGPGPAQQAASILYGLYQETVTIAAFNVLPEFNGNIGRIEDGVNFYLVVDPDSFDFRGSGSLNLINLTDAAIAAFIKSSAQPTQGRKALYLKGSALTTVEIAKGSVGIAAFPNETATATTVLVGFDQNQSSDSDVELGSGLTLTTLTQSGGKVLQKCATTTTSVAKGAVWTSEGSGAIGTLNMHGTGYANSSGTITTLNLYGTLDLSGDRTARTITTLNRKPGSVLIRHSGITITTDNKPTDPGEFRDILVG
jgi:hypothetical protein